MILSDSCAAANKTKQCLAEVIKDLSGNEEQSIFLGDCSMHLCSNAEKQIVKVLSTETLKVLKYVNDVLALSKDPLRVTWNRTNPNAVISSEHGSRFGHTSNNAVTILKLYSELLAFCRTNSSSSKLFELKRTLVRHEHIVKSELLSIGVAWFLIINPLWNRLKVANAHNSVMLIEEFIKLS